MMRTRGRSSCLRLPLHWHSQWWRVVALVALLAPVIVASGRRHRRRRRGAPRKPARPITPIRKARRSRAASSTFYSMRIPDSLNPLVGQTTIAVQVSLAILEGLTYHDPDGNFQHRAQQRSCRRWRTAESPRISRPSPGS